MLFIVFHLIFDLTGSKYSYLDKPRTHSNLMESLDYKEDYEMYKASVLSEEGRMMFIFFFLFIVVIIIKI